MARSWLKSISQTRRQIWTPGFLVVRAGFLLPRKCQIDTPSGELVVGSRDAVTEDDQSECGGFSQGRPCSVEPQQVEFSFCNVLPRQRSSRQPAPLSTLQAEFNSTVLMFRHQERN